MKIYRGILYKVEFRDISKSRIDIYIIDVVIMFDR